MARINFKLTPEQKAVRDLAIAETAKTHTVNELMAVFRCEKKQVIESLARTKTTPAVGLKVNKKNVGQFRVLAYLLRNRHKTRAEICEELGLSLECLSHIVSQAQHSGLLDAIRDLSRIRHLEI